MTNMLMSNLFIKFFLEKLPFKRFIGLTNMKPLRGNVFQEIKSLVNLIIKLINILALSYTVFEMHNIIIFPVILNIAFFAKLEHPSNKKEKKIWTGIIFSTEKTW